MHLIQATCHRCSIPPRRPSGCSSFGSEAHSASRLVTQCHHKYASISVAAANNGTLQKLQLVCEADETPSADAVAVLHPAAGAAATSPGEAGVTSVPMKAVPATAVLQAAAAVAPDAASALPYASTAPATLPFAGVPQAAPLPASVPASSLTFSDPGSRQVSTVPPAAAPPEAAVPNAFSIAALPAGLTSAASAPPVSTRIAGICPGAPDDYVTEVGAGVCYIDRDLLFLLNDNRILPLVSCVEAYQHSSVAS